MPDTLPPEIIVYFEEGGYPGRLTVGPTVAVESLRSTGEWDCEVLSDDSTDGRGMRLEELREAVQVMHSASPVQDAEGRWVYGEAPKGGE